MRSGTSGPTTGGYVVVPFHVGTITGTQTLKWKAPAAGRIHSISANAVFSVATPTYAVATPSGNVQAARNFPATTTTEVREEANLTTANRNFAKGADITITLVQTGATVVNASVILTCHLSGHVAADPHND